MEKNKEEKKLSYDELKNICGQLQQQNNFMREQLMKSHNEDMYKRIDYLFKVVENYGKFNLDFVNNCIVELESILTISDQQDSQDNKETK